MAALRFHCGSRKGGPERDAYAPVFCQESYPEDPMNLIKVIATGAVIAVPAITRAENLAPMALNSLPAPPRNIMSAQVENLHGQTIGRVAKVATDQSGKLAAISVITPAGTIVVAAGAASYDEGRNLVYTDQPAQGLANAAH